MAVIAVLVLAAVTGSTSSGSASLISAAPAEVSIQVPHAAAPADLAAEFSRLLSRPHVTGIEERIRLSRQLPPRVNGRVQPRRVHVPDAASGRYAVVPGRAGAPGRGPAVRYVVEIERGLPFSGQEFAAEVHRILNHEKGWGRAGRTRFLRVDGGYRGHAGFRVSLSSPDLTDKRCAPLRTFGEVSCFARGRAVINARRWGTGAPTYGKDIAAYREYLVSHEVGHALGHDHEECPGSKARAPVMVQQTKSLDGCRANPWPFP